MPKPRKACERSSTREAISGPRPYGASASGSMRSSQTGPRLLTLVVERPAVDPENETKLGTLMVEALKCFDEVGFNPPPA